MVEAQPRKGHADRPAGGEPLVLQPIARRPAPGRALGLTFTSPWTKSGVFGAGRRRPEIRDSSLVRTRAQSRPELESPRAGDLNTAGCEISSAPLLRVPAHHSKRRRPLYAYGVLPPTNQREPKPRAPIATTECRSYGLPAHSPVMRGARSRDGLEQPPPLTSALVPHLRVTTATSLRNVVAHAPVPATASERKPARQGRKRLRGQKH